MDRWVTVSRFLVVLALLASLASFASVTVWAQETDPAAPEEAITDGGDSGGGGETVVTDPGAGTAEEGTIPEEAPPVQEVPPVEEAPPVDEGAPPSEGTVPEEGPPPEGEAPPEVVDEPKDGSDQPTDTESLDPADSGSSDGAATTEAAPDAPAESPESGATEGAAQETGDAGADTAAEAAPTEIPVPRTDQDADGDFGTADHSGAVIAHKVDGVGGDLPGACFAVFFDSGDGPIEANWVNGACDVSDGQLDGFTTVGGLAPGLYLLLEIIAPDGYEVGGVVSFSIDEVGDVAEVTVANETGGATLAIAKFDETFDPLPGACFQIHADAGGGTQGVVIAFSCDFFDGADDGLTVIGGLVPGAYVAVEIYAPSGYPVGAQLAFVIGEGQTEEYLEFVNEPGGATLYVDKIDQFGVPQFGVCFDVFVDAGGGALGDYVTSNCDAFDAWGIDGTTVIPGLLPGDYVLNEYNVPHGYEAGRFQVTIGEAVTEVTFTARNVPSTAHVQVIVCYLATDGETRTEVDVLSLLPEEIALADAGDAGCAPGEGEVFDLVAGEAVIETLVTDASGRADADVPPGLYVLVEPGEGYVDLGELVAGGRYTVLIQHFVAADDLPDPPEPTPGDPGEDGFGTLEVFVFDCTEGGDATQILVSEPAVEGDAFAAAETHAAPDTCEPGTATVVFDDSDEEVEIEIGVTFFNVHAGIYSITEVCSEATAEFGVFAGETTKVLIFDFGAPCAGEETPTPTEEPSETPAATPVTSPVTTLPSTGTGDGGDQSRVSLTAVLLLILAAATIGFGHARRGRSR